MNSRRKLLVAMAGAGGLAGLALCGRIAATGPGGLAAVRRSSHALGANVEIVAVHASRDTAERAVAAALDELQRIEDIVSLYRPGSEISRLNRHGVLERPDPDFVSLLQYARHLSARTGGAFDVTVQPLWELYASAYAEGRLPGREAIDATRARVGLRKLDVGPRRVRLGPGMGVTLNGIAQGFAADRVLDVLRRHGIENALVDTGELGAVGSKENGAPWTVGIQDPRRADAFVSIAPLDGRCLATSGDYATTFSADFSCHHIFDPATGRSPQAFRSVSVVASSGLDADALSTAAFVLGLPDGLRLIDEWPGADALFVLKDGSVQATARFPGRMLRG
jgi:thiamine biosynthesis lipoprotein